MRARCPHCWTVQEVNSDVGDLDFCDDCGEPYEQFPNKISGDVEGVVAKFGTDANGNYLYRLRLDDDKLVKEIHMTSGAWDRVQTFETFEVRDPLGKASMGSGDES